MTSTTSEDAGGSTRIRRLTVAAAGRANRIGGRAPQAILALTGLPAGAALVRFSRP
jgi:hypothetical protein